MNRTLLDTIVLISSLLIMGCASEDPVKVLSFAPADGVVIREPEGNERGYWAGAPGIYYDEGQDLFYLTYRLHSHECFPNTQIMKRGHLARIAVSRNGIDFTDVKEFRTADFKSSSLGRASLIKCEDGMYRYFMCHDNPDETQWTIGMMEAPGIEQLNPENYQPVFTSGDAVTLSLRDPYIFRYRGIYHLFVTIESIEWNDLADEDKKYEGITVKRSTGLATSVDGIHFSWQGEMFGPTRGEWDSDCRRISCLVDFGKSLAGFYDGSAGYENNHEDLCALVMGPAVNALKPVRPETFLIKSPWGTGSCRYVDVIEVKKRRYFYYECSRADESHDVRVFVR